MNHGDSIEYIFAMAADILKLSLGECYLPTLAATFGCKLPNTALKFLDSKHIVLKTKSAYKVTIGGKRKRAAARVALKKKIQPGSVVDEVTPGACLFWERPFTRNERACCTEVLLYHFLVFHFVLFINNPVMQTHFLW